jgi:hypothetical protein
MPAEGVSIYTGETYYGSGSASDITLSYNIIGEGLIQHDDGRGHPSGGFMSGYDGDPSFAAQRITLHHNLIVHTQKRNGDVLTKSGRLINNLIYNWQWLPSVIAGGVTADIINNSYKAGPVTQYSYDLNKGAIHLVPSDADINLSTVPYWWHSVPGSPSLYLNGNQFKDQSDTVLAYDTDMVCHYRNFDTGCTDINTSWLRNTKLQEPNELGITIDTTLAAETKVLAGAGSSQRIDASGNWINNRDSVDNRFVNEYKTGSYLLGTKFPWHEDLVGGQSFVSNQVNFQDNDKDGMPDSWEIKYGLNPNDPTDAIKKTLNNQGYTNIEVYFNGL